MEPKRVPVSLVVTLQLCVVVAVRVALLDGASLGDCVALVAALGVTLGELAPLPDRDGLGEAVALGDRVGEGVGRRLGVAVSETLAVDDPD